MNQSPAPAPKRRVEQLNTLVQQEVAKIILREIEFPADIFVTIAKVQVADDAESAKVWISVLPAAKQELALEKITNRIADIQRLLNRRLVMKFVPKLTFFIDESGERAAAVTKVLDSIAKDRGLGLDLDAQRVEEERQQREAKKAPPADFPA